MHLPYFIARRHLLGRHKIGYISFISLISTIGLAVGVAAMILTISILNGFEYEVKSKLIDFDAHIRLRTFYSDEIDSTARVEQGLAEIPQIRFAAPYIHRSAMIRHGNETDGIIVEGINTEDLKQTLKIDRFMKAGELSFDAPGNYNGLVTGRKLAQNLGAEIGDKIYLFLINSGSGMNARPKVGRFILNGVYDSGISDYDDIFVYTSLAAAQEFFEMGGSFSGYQIVLDDPLAAEAVADTINKRLGFPYNAMSWNDLHSNLFRWLKVQRFPIMLVFGLIAIVAIFNIVSSLMMIVLEKTKDIGILKSMGLNRGHIFKIFLFEGGIIGLSGTFIGFMLAFLLAWLQNRFGLISIPEDVYFMNQLPVLLNWKNFVGVGAGALFFALLATLYPATKSQKIPPSEAVRYE